MAKRLSTRRYLAERMKAGQGFRVKAVKDAKTCKLCASLDGKYKNGNGDAPPYHPNCRCGESH